MVEIMRTSGSKLDMKQIKELSLKELIKLFNQLKIELLCLKIKKAKNEKINFSEFTNIRISISRVLTFLNSKKKCR